MTAIMNHPSSQRFEKSVGDTSRLGPIRTVIKRLSEWTGLLHRALAKTGARFRESSRNPERSGSVEDEEYEELRNREINAAQVPSETEHVTVPAIWVFEVLTPSTAENLATAVERLGWDQEDERHPSAGFVHSVARLRRSAYGGSWINLGWIVPPTANNVAWSHNRVAELPDGVRSVSAHIIQFTPSITVLAFQFLLGEKSSFAVDEALRELPGSWRERTRWGYRIYSAEHLKLAGSEAVRGSLRTMCSEWVANTFPGYFVTYVGRERLPVGEVIFTEETRPLNGEKTGIYGDFLRVLGLSSPFHGWEATDWPGMYVVFPGAAGGEHHRIVITARVADVAAQGDRHAGESDMDAILGRLFYWHRTIATWVLQVVVDSFQESAGRLRDAYGTLEPASAEAAPKLHELNGRLLNLERDGVPFAEEMKSYAQDERRLVHDVQEFRSTDERYRAHNPEVELIRSIGKQLMASSDSFLERMDQLRRIADRSTAVASAEATDRLSRANVRLARTNVWLQVAVVALTLVMLGLALYEPVLRGLLLP